MYEGILLGIVQGITEWLPISSDGAITLIKVNFFGGTDLSETLRYALLLHLGTFLAAFVYLRGDVKRIAATAISYNRASAGDRALFNFLFISTLISGALGFVIFLTIDNFENVILLSSRAITLVVGTMLLLTGVMQLRFRKPIDDGTLKSAKDLRFSDGILLGIAQGLAVLPGLSRSGLTVSFLLLRRFNDIDALKISFLMSLPIVLAGNIVLNFRNFSLSPDLFYGLVFSFVFGVATIHMLVKISQKVNFGYFVVGFGFLVLASAAI